MAFVGAVIVIGIAATAAFVSAVWWALCWWSFGYTQWANQGTMQ